ncbi:MAG: citryl-CoA lyase [Parcubacteria group bacterium]|jgi:citryl-CoA lyase|nr:citryl-CoA lyase [Parcubacteria group bacterium]|tara:strand:+ start:10914 stop:11630 length:717 start_codon:yes stop_codon:yes gene_type:complete
MDYKTSISKMTADDHIIRGEKLSDLMSGSFSDAIFLILAARKPNDQESKIFSTMLISVIDHGMGTTSSQAARFVASGGNSVNTAIASGVLSLGDYHGGAIEGAMKQLINVNDVAEFVKNNLDNKNLIYGFGHKIYKEADPRTQQILKLCQELSYQSKYIDLVQSIETELEKQKVKKLPLNVDGVMAAILLEMGFSAKAGKALFVIGRTPGLAAQVIEEQENEKPVRRVSEEEIKYEGK